jgi:5-methylcytosine-specific restriction protein A
MESLTATFQEFANLFSEQKFQQFGGNSSIRLLHEVAPDILKDLAPGFERYKIYGSVGTGNWAEIPWVAILDRDISTTTQKGYYIVYLFDKSLRHIYLSLGVGYMQFENEYGVSEARTHIQAVSQHYAAIISKNAPGFKPGVINLGAENNLGKGYERGAVLAKRYTIAELNDDELARDLQIMLEHYAELKSLVGDSILNIELDVDADLYDNSIKNFQKEIVAKTYHAVDEKVIDELLKQAKTYPRQIREKLVRQITRNRKIATLVKEKNLFVCSICGRAPFIQKNGRPYAEADHIVPLGGETMGADAAENLRCLCAQCHAIITHGSSEEIAKLLNASIA